MIKLSVIISNYNRLNLLRQTLDTLRKNTKSEYKITVVDDASEDIEVKNYLSDQKDIIHYETGIRLPIYEVKNKGKEISPDSEYIHFCDNDIFYLPDWDLELIDILDNFPEIGIVGGKHHPHHTILERIKYKDKWINIMSVQPGYSLMIRSKDYDRFGPFTYREPNKFMGEDAIFCEKAMTLGFKIAAIDSPVLFHCGLTNFQHLYASEKDDILRNKNLYPEMIIE